MKVLINLVFLATFAIVVEKTFAHDKETMLKAAETCAQQNGITMEELEAMKQKKMAGEEIPESAIEQKHKCFTYCFLKETDGLDAEGKVDGEKIQNAEKLDDEKKSGLMDCKALTEMIEDECEYGFKYVECAAQYFPQP